MLQLKDIFKAPLDAAYGSLKQIHAEADRDMVDSHFAVKEINDPMVSKRYGTPLRTLVPLENVFQFKNKNGVTQEINGPTIAFEQLTSLHLKELVLDFDVGISEMRRRSDGELVVNASLQAPTEGGPSAAAGGFHFSVVYKNELPAGVSKLQSIFSDVLDGQYTILKDSDDIALEGPVKRRVAISKAVNNLSSSVEELLSNTQVEDGGYLVLFTLTKLSRDVKTIKTYVEEYPDETVGILERFAKLLERIPMLADLQNHVVLWTGADDDDATKDFGLRYRTITLDDDVSIIDRIYGRTMGEWDIPSSATWTIDDTKLLVPFGTANPSGA